MGACMGGIDSSQSKGLHLKIMAITTRKILIVIFIIGVVIPGCVLGVILLILMFISGDGALSLAFGFLGLLEMEVYVILFIVIPLMTCVALAGWVYSTMSARRKVIEEDQSPPPQPSPASGEGES